jgi:hypothetical protein
VELVEAEGLPKRRESDFQSSRVLVRFYCVGKGWSWPMRVLVRNGLAYPQDV